VKTLASLALLLALSGVAHATETQPVTSGTQVIAGGGTIEMTYDPVSGLISIKCLPVSAWTVIKVTRAGGGTGTTTDVTSSDTNGANATFTMIDTYLQGDGTATVTYSATIKKGDDCYRVTYTVTPDTVTPPPGTSTTIVGTAPVSIPCP
jgi:hypothetical protein